MSWLGQLFSRRHLYRDLSDEIEEHVQERTAELVASGMSQQDAASQARREFGNSALLEERGREVWQWQPVERLLRDARLAIRQLRRNPGFTFTVVLTLALAIGANTAVFSLVNTLLLRPLPYSSPQGLAIVVRYLHGVTPKGQVVDDVDDGQDGETWELIRDHVTAARFAAEYHGADGVNLEANHQARYVKDHRVSAAYFDVLGIKPVMGRTFTQEEDTPHGPNAVILSYELWKSVFSSDPQVLGRAIRLKGEPYTVVGVMPPHIQTTAVADLWTPVRPWHGGEGGGPNYQLLIRLNSGATWAQVDAQLHALRPDLFNHMLKGATVYLAARPLQEDLADGSRTPALMLMGAVVLILVIACINIAGLMLVRVYRREDEVATRLALGATKGSIVRQLFMEPLVLTVAGTALGITLAYLALESFVRLLPPDMLPATEITMDYRVLLFAVLCAAASAIFIGLIPTLATRKFQIRPSLSGRTSAGPQRSRARLILTTSEVCLTLVLLAGAGVLVRTLIYLQTLPPGFDANNVTIAKLSLDDARFRNAADFRALLQKSLEAMRQIPGVNSAAVGLGVPYERGLNDGFKIVDGPTAGTGMASSSSYITPDYFRAFRIPVIAGRVFTDEDTSESAKVAIVNASFARKFFHSMDVVGRHLRLGDDLCTVLGVVGDVTKEPGVMIQAPLATEPMYYVPATQVSTAFLTLVHTWFQPSWIVRSSGPISGLDEQMQKALEKAAPNLPFAEFHPMSDLQATALSQQRVEVMLLTVLASLALLLSLVGVYGMVSNLVAQRRREIGIRMALGCTLSQAMVEIGRSGVIAVILGLGVGLGASAFSLQAIKSQLFGVRSLDPVTLIAACVLLLLAACVASFAPTLRIARINPASTLRSE
jgi:predicted permease